MRNDLLHHLVHPFLGRKWTFNGDEFAVNPENHRRADLYMNIRGVAIHCGLENLVEKFHAKKLPNPLTPSITENGAQAFKSKGTHFCVPQKSRSENLRRIVKTPFAPVSFRLAWTSR